MCNISKEGSPKVWYLDSSCSNHMSGNEILFSFNSGSSSPLCLLSMDRAFTSTECMKMPGNVVDAEYQKVTKPVP